MRPEKRREKSEILLRSLLARFMKRRSLLLLLAVLLAGSSCVQKNIHRKEKITGRGKVILVDQGGGFYGIITPKGRMLYPLNLPPDLMKRGKHIRFTGIIEEDITGLEKWGEYILLEHVEYIRRGH